MSQPAEENNNQDMPDAYNEAAPYQRDLKYYYSDRSAVILVGDVLFKFQLSLISPPCDTPGGLISRSSELRESLANSSDGNPVRLRGFTPDQFRNFLKVVLGLPSDPGYLALLRGAQDTKKHGRDLLVQYLDIASLSQQFEMAELERWARRQLRLVLRSSHNFAHSQWDRDTLHQLHSYACSRSGLTIQWRAKTFIQYFISVSADKDQKSSALVPLNFNTCIELYKDDTLKQRDPALFGCLFAAIVSQHHRSGVWTSPLTQRDKALLYVAQVQLTSIAKELQSLYWLLAPASKLPFCDEICPACQSALPRLWMNTFGRCGSLDSSVLLKDISSLAHLPQYLHSLSQTWSNVNCMGLPGLSADGHRPPSTGVLHSLTVGLMVGMGLSEQSGPHERLPEGQTCCYNYIAGIGDLIDQVYNELAAQHAKFEPEI